MVKNLDYLPNLAPFNVVRRCQPKDGYKTLETTLTIYPYGVDSMNEYGLIVCYNMGLDQDKPKHVVPISAVCQEILEQCKTTKEAIKFLRDSNAQGARFCLSAIPQVT